MNRASAQRLVDQLRNVTEARGATGPEAAVAASKAAELTARYGLGEPARRTSPRRAAPRPAPAAGFKSWSGGAAHVPFEGWAPGPRGAQPWSFNAATGEASANVKVHSYRDRANWRIEIDA